MKAQRILAVIVPMLIGIAAFVMVQCTKEHPIQPDDKSIQTRSNLSKANVSLLIDCMTESFPNNPVTQVFPDYTIKIMNIDGSKLPLIPPGVIGNCSPFEAIFDITAVDYYGNNYNEYFLFSDFRLSIPNTIECNSLNNYINELASSNYSLYLQTINQLSTYIAMEGKRLFMEKYVKRNNVVDGSSEARVYFVKCYQPYKLTALVPIYALSGSDDPKDWEIIGYETKEYIEFVSCGEGGCCRFSQKYRYNPNSGQVVTDLGEWISIGFCDSSFKDCTQRCQ